LYRQSLKKQGPLNLSVTWDKEVTNPFDTVAALCGQMISLFFEFVMSDGSSVDFAALSISPLWFECLTQLAQLQKVSLSQRIGELHQAQH
jgi:hypothetical protein